MIIVYALICIGNFEFQSYSCSPNFNLTKNKTKTRFQVKAQIICSQTKQFHLFWLQNTISTLERQILLKNYFFVFSQSNSKRVLTRKTYKLLLNYHKPFFIFVYLRMQKYVKSMKKLKLSAVGLLVCFSRLCTKLNNYRNLI